MTLDRLVVRLCALVIACLAVPPLTAQNLEIHVINVGWGQASFIKGPGPTGKTVLLEAGNTGKGTAEVVPYLQSIGHLPSAGFDYTILGHQHCDHAGGMDEVINAGYDVRIRNYDNGSSYTSSCITGWDGAAAGTTAGTPVAITRGEVIDLGGGATLTCIVVGGRVIGGANVSVSNENDLSIGLLLQYGGFDYFWASDLGGGADDGSCTGRSTSQLNVETAVIQAISPGGASPLISAGGIDVLHVSHHGSESSTNNDLFDGASPAVAVISTGAGQSSTWHLPRIDVVDNVLLANASSCVTAPPTFVVQSEEGSPVGSGTSFSGYSVGDIVITTDGAVTFNVDGNGAVTQGPSEKTAAGLPRSFTLDDSGGGSDVQAPTTSITAPANGATVTGTTLVTASASDNVGVTRVEFWLDGALASTDTTSPYEWSWNALSAGNGSHALVSKAYDAASNAGTSSTVTVTVSNDAISPTTSITAPANGATVSGMTSVTASASDDVGVTRVEFWLDGALASTDTTVPYEWSWDTTTATSGSHALVSKAYDAASNAGTSSTVNVTVSNGVSVANYRIVQAASALTYYLPAGISIPSKGYVIVARNATKAQFEAFWGVTLAANVIFVSSADAMPQINGGETYTLYNAANAKIDGATVAMASAGGESLQRKNGCGNANKAASWNRLASAAGTPGSGAPAACGKGIYISEFSDALGTGNYIYEFVELHNDN